MAYAANTDYSASPNGQPAPTGVPTLDATTLANLGLSQAEAQGRVLVDNRPVSTQPGMFFQPLQPNQMGPPTLTADSSAATTVGQAMHKWYTMDSTDVEELQHRLWDAGLYPRSWYTKGQEPAWGDPFTDNQGASAYRTLLRRASTSNKSINEILSQSAGQGQQKLDKAFSPVLTNPDDLKAAIKKGAQSVLGQNVSDAEAQKIVDAYQQADYNAKFAQFQANTTGGPSPSSPNPTDFVNQQLQNLHPDEAAATTFNNLANSLLSGVESERATRAVGAGPNI